MAESKLNHILITEGISQVDLAKEAKLSYTTVNNACTMRTEISTRSKYKILKALNSITKKNWELKVIFPNKIGEE